MIRTTILAEDGLMLEIRSMAQRAGVSVSELIRRALEEFVRGHGNATPYPTFIGAGESGGAMRVSENDERLLFQEKPRKGR